MEDFQGSWTAVSVILDGKPMPKGEVRKLTMLIRPGGRYETRGMEGNDGDFKIDPAKNPGFIDMMPARGREQGKTYRGIYELNGNGLKVCTASPGKDRPCDFTSKPGSGYRLFVWKDSARQDRQKLQGTWKVVSAEVDGKPAKDAGIKKLVFAGTEFTMVTDEGPWKSYYELDVTGKPKAIDFLTIDMPQKAIYKIEEDKLYVCLGDTGSRPTDFGPKSGLLLVLKRDIPAAKKPGK